MLAARGASAQLAAVTVALGRRRRGMVDDLGVGPLSVLVLRQALLEALDALGDVAHDRGYATAAAEDQQRDERENEQMPAAEAHCRLLLLGQFHHVKAEFILSNKSLRFPQL